ncbi:hypothetical protein BS50DRAFT_574950 [Corynespora cassiicola Philippines]|uniref:Uncharacterized protein n=1 Tax=Corynespora cassiicola Philippines TaxID=1448308 RepID=A0A2T2NMF4_CORCC|nr:hypothetical protein BS50DRAFT_574950 [Corynespora cassiicola Philippines]
MARQSLCVCMFALPTLSFSQALRGEGRPMWLVRMPQHESVQRLGDTGASEHSASTVPFRTRLRGAGIKLSMLRSRAD